jgi:hypothetical protein
MNDARSLIAAFHEINSSKNNTVAHFTPSLVGMFGSTGIFESFLAELDAALASGKVPASIKKRSANLTGTFIPQVADYNGISNLTGNTVTADALRSITADTLANRRAGVVIILAALMTILTTINGMD